MNAIVLCARQELLLAVRSRWLQLFAVVFAALALAVASAGYILSGGYGLQDFARTAASLVQLVLLIMPLTALTFGALSFTPERGSAELLFAQPVSRVGVLAGRYLGLLISLAAAQAIGFGLAGLVLHRQSGETGLSAFVAVVAISLVLTAVFLSIAAMLAQARAARRARVLALALVVWFGAVVLYDVAVLGVASQLRSGAASRLLITAVLVNPADAARTIALLAVEGTAAFGAASLALLRFTGGAGNAVLLTSISLLVWTIAPLVIAARRLARADL
jgi:Cu-processing system permease protein